MSEYQATYVPPAVFPVVLEDAIELMLPALNLSSGRHSPDTLRHALIEERWQLWMCYRTSDNKSVAALASEIMHYPCRKMLNLLFCGGEDVEGWYDPLLDATEVFARQNGCMGMELVGRRGWERLLRKRGWDAKHVVCELEFKEPETKNVTPFHSKPHPEDLEEEEKLVGVAS